MPASADEAAGDLLRRGRAARLAWMTLGLLLVGVGFVGLAVPLLPTTDFLLLALPCFARSSPRLEGWLLRHRRFGPTLTAWRAERAVPRRAKMLACVGMAAGYALFCLHARPGALLSLAVAAFMIFWASWIIRRPEPAGRR